LFARGAIAAAFNDEAQADRDLGAVIRSAPNSDAATMASGLLAGVYARNGQIRKALAQLDRPGAVPAPDWKDSRERLAVLARYPEMSVAARSYSRLRYQKKREMLVLGVSVNGRPADFILDTGASLSVMAESRARSLGLTIHSDAFTMSDIAGKKLPCRVATAGEIAAGSFRLRNVPFCVLPDNQPGFVADPEAEPAILGLPVLIAFGTLRWDAAGNFEIGFPSKRPKLQDSNICFDSSSLLLEANVARRRLSFELDTGNPTTMMFSGWGEETGAAAGKREKHEFQGMGEAVQVEAAQIRELHFGVAGKDLVLKSVPLLVEPIEAECVNCAGNAGMDLLNLARRVTLDFNSMRLTLETAR